MKKIILYCATAFFSLCGCLEVSADTISVKINDVGRVYDQEPIIRDNRVFIPIRGITEDTNGTVTFLNKEKKVTINKNGTVIEFVVGSNRALVNGVAKEIPESFILNGRTLLPIRFINEMLGYRVDWSNIDKIVSIKTSRGLVVENIIKNSQKYLGTPYLYGGTFERDKMFDCSSFTQKVFFESGLQLPRTSAQQSLIGEKVDINNARTGDLVFFDINNIGKVTHVAIYIDENTLLQSTTSLGVNYTPFSKYWKDRLFSIRDVIQINE